MEQLKIDQQAELEAYQQQLDDLRTKVSDVMSKLVNKNITEQEATEAIRDLGCEVEFVDAPR